MWTPISVVVPEPLIKRSAQFGVGMWKEFKRREGELGPATKDGHLQSTPKLQGMARLCEVIGALACGVDADELNWSLDGVDPGHDFKLPCGLKVNVKGTWVANARYLIFAQRATRLYDEHDFDLVMMVWAADPEGRHRGYGEARGWMGKQAFKDMHYVVRKGDGNHVRGISFGSWIMRQDQLNAMAELVAGKMRDDRRYREEVFSGGRRAGEVSGGDTQTAVQRDMRGGNGKMEEGHRQPPVADASGDQAG